MNKKQSQDKGQGLVEYAFILGLVVIIVIVVVVVLGPQVSNMYNQVVTNWPS